MAGAAGADLLVGRVGREAARVADRRREDAGRLPELPLRAPEAAQAEERQLRPAGNGGSSGAPFTKCDFGTGMRSARPGSASSGDGSLSLWDDSHMVHLGRGDWGDGPVTPQNRTETPCHSEGAAVASYAEGGSRPVPGNCRWRRGGRTRQP